MRDTETRCNDQHSRYLAGGLLLGLLWCAEAAPAQDVDPLSQFFSVSQVEEARSYQRDFVAAATTADVANLYRRALALEQQLLAPIRDAHQYADWPALSSFRGAAFDLPGLAPTCTAECSEPAFALILSDFVAMATKTAGNADDSFFRLLGKFYRKPQAYYGKLSGWPNFVGQTWDYGGHSLLGQGAYLLLLLRFDEYFTVHELFSAEVRELRTRLLEDLFDSTCSGLPAAAALKEIDGILRQVRLSQAEAERLTRRRQAFEDPAAHGIEVDCQQQTCPCNSG